MVDAIAEVERIKKNYLEKGNLGRVFLLASARFNITEKLTRGFYEAILNKDVDGYLDKTLEELKIVPLLSDLTKSQLRNCCENLLLLRTLEPRNYEWRVNRCADDRLPDLKETAYPVDSVLKRIRKLSEEKEAVLKENESRRASICAIKSRILSLISEFVRRRDERRGSPLILAYVKAKVCYESHAESTVKELHELILKDGMTYVSEEDVKEFFEESRKEEVKKMYDNVEDFKYENLEVWVKDMVSSLEDVILNDPEAFDEYVDRLLFENSLPFTKEEYKEKLRYYMKSKWKDD